MKKSEERLPVNPLPEDADAIPRPANELDGDGADGNKWPKDKAPKRPSHGTQQS